MSEEPPDRQQKNLFSPCAPHLFLCGQSNAQHYHLSVSLCTRYSRLPSGEITETEMNYTPALEFVKRNFPGVIESALNGERVTMQGSNGVKNLSVRTNLSLLEIHSLFD